MVGLALAVRMVLWFTHNLWTTWENHWVQYYCDLGSPRRKVTQFAAFTLRVKSVLKSPSTKPCPPTWYHRWEDSQEPVWRRTDREASPPSSPGPWCPLAPGTELKTKPNWRIFSEDNLLCPGQERVRRMVDGPVRLLLSSSELRRHNSLSPRARHCSSPSHAWPSHAIGSKVVRKLMIHY